MQNKNISYKNKENISEKFSLKRIACVELLKYWFKVLIFYYMLKEIN